MKTKNEFGICADCGKESDLQEHHISYKPKKTKFVCIKCHEKIHNHGVGKIKNPKNSESGKQLILGFLEKHHGEKFNVREMANQIANETPKDKISYQTVLKYVAVLIAAKRIRCEDYGVVKIVWID